MNKFVYTILMGVLVVSFIVGILGLTFAGTNAFFLQYEGLSIIGLRVAGFSVLAFVGDICLMVFILGVSCGFNLDKMDKATSSAGTYKFRIIDRGEKEGVMDRPRGFPRYAISVDDSGWWGQGDTPAEAIGSTVLHAPKRFGITVTNLEDFTEGEPRG